MHLLHGPNLNLVGQREPALYGSRSFDSLVANVNHYAVERGIACNDFQSNHEGQMLDYIHQLPSESWIVINAGAWTHTSVALRDALTGIKANYVEVHLSQVHARETFRHRSYLSAKAQAYFSGFGLEGYYAAIDFISLMQAHQVAA